MTIEISTSYALAAVAALVTLAAWASGILFSKSKKQEPAKPVPQSQATMAETMGAFTRRHFPFFLLEEAQKMKNHDLFRMSIPKPEGVWCCGDAAFARKIMNEPKHGKPTFLAYNVDRIFGAKSLWSSQINDRWKRVRKGASPAFSNKETTRMSEVGKSQLKRWVDEVLEPAIASNGTFDPSVEMNIVTFRFICEAAFEYLVTDEEMYGFFHDWHFAEEEMGVKQLNPLRRFARYFLPAHWEAMFCANRYQNFVWKMVETHRRNRDNFQGNTVVRLVSELDVPKKQMIADLIIFLVGGHDTGGFTMGTTLYMLAKNPKLSLELTKALRAVKGNGAECPLLQWIIKETHRYMGVGALGIPRALYKDEHYTKNGRDFIVPKGACVFFSQLVMGRDPATFPNPDVYDPYRWENATPEMEDCIIPFSVGIRACIGKPLAVVQLNTIMGSIFHDYIFEVDTHGEFHCVFTTGLKGGKLRARRVGDVDAELKALSS